MKRAIFVCLLLRLISPSDSYSHTYMLINTKSMVLKIYLDFNFKLYLNFQFEDT